MGWFSTSHGAVGPFLMLCFLLTWISCTRALWFLHGRDVPLFRWSECCYCYRFCRKWLMANLICILSVWHPIRWRSIIRWNLYMLSFYNYNFGWHRPSFINVFKYYCVMCQNLDCEHTSTSISTFIIGKPRFWSWLWHGYSNFCIRRTAFRCGVLTCLDCLGTGWFWQCLAFFLVHVLRGF